MEAYYVISVSVLIFLFLFFLVISRSLASAVDYLTRVEFLLNTEKKFREEELEIKKVLALDEEFGDL